MNIKEKKCQRCQGKGKIMATPYYSSPMPKEKEYVCSICKGKGIILMIPCGYGYEYDFKSGFNEYPKI